MMGPKMPAYLISDVTVRDLAAFETYRTRAAASIKAFGGQYVTGAKLRASLRFRRADRDSG